MFPQNFIKLSAAVREISFQQKKTVIDAENNTVIAAADSNKMRDGKARVNRKCAKVSRDFIVAVSNKQPRHCGRICSTRLRD